MWLSITLRRMTRAISASNYSLPTPWDGTNRERVSLFPLFSVPRPQVIAIMRQQNTTLTLGIIPVPGYTWDVGTG